MAITKTSVTVMRYWNRVAESAPARSLSHPAFRWLYAVIKQWNGHNNGVIEFTRRRHGAVHGLDHHEVFERARKEVMDAGLVLCTHPGGRNLPALYALAGERLQAPHGRPVVGAPRAPTAPEILGALDAPMEAKTGALDVPNWSVRRPKESELHIRNARASDLEKEKYDCTTVPVITATAPTSANPSNATESSGKKTMVESNGIAIANHLSALGVTEHETAVLRGQILKPGLKEAAHMQHSEKTPRRVGYPH